MTENVRSIDDIVWKRMVAKSHFIPFCGCILFAGKSDKDGYGFIEFDGKPRLAHRVSYMIHKGQPRNFVCHTCDIPACINPDHLYDGTNSQNMQDRTNRGRAKMAVGERHGISKFKSDQIIEIRNMYSNGFTMRQIADKFGVKGTANISKIVNRLTWRHI